MLGELELKNDDWVKAKETLRAASDATDGKDPYATLSLVYLLFNGHFILLSLCSKFCIPVPATIVRMLVESMCWHLIFFIPPISSL